MPDTVDQLANAIRQADGNHDLGAGALAEALMPFLDQVRAEGVVEGRQDIAECIGEVKYGWDKLEKATTIVTQAMAVLALSNAVSDLVSWHPKYNYEDRRDRRVVRGLMVIPAHYKEHQ